MNEHLLLTCLLVVVIIMLMHKCKCDHEALEGLVASRAKYVTHVAAKQLADRNAAFWNPSSEFLVGTGVRDVGPKELSERLFMGM